MRLSGYGVTGYVRLGRGLRTATLLQLAGALWDAVHQFEWNQVIQAPCFNINSAYMVQGWRFTPGVRNDLCILFTTLNLSLNLYCAYRSHDAGGIVLACDHTFKVNVIVVLCTLLTQSHVWAGQGLMTCLASPPNTLPSPISTGIATHTLPSP